MLTLRPLLFIFTILYSYSALCQQPCNILFTHNSDSIKTWQQALQQQHLSEIRSFTGKQADEKKILYEEKFTFVKSHFEQDELVTDPVATNYIRAIMAKLHPAVKEFTPPGGIIVHLSKVGVPNAFTPGYNTVFINAGLLTRLQNEAQLAFVLCHEMAHVVLKHGEQAADQYLASIQSKEFRQEVAAIKRQEYGKGRAMEQLAKRFSFDHRRHSRFKETSADSLAIVWLKQTGFSLGQVNDCLALLDSIDIDICDTKKAFEKHLSFAEYPVKSSYFGVARRSVFGAAAFTDDAESMRTKDSLRTHPDCKQRMQYARMMIPETAQHAGAKFAVDSAAFTHLQQRLRNEIIDFALNSEKTSLGLFYAIELLDAGSQDIFIATAISKAFNQLYTAQKNHVLGRVVDLPNPQLFSKAYNELLYFIQHASLTDLASINYYFTGTALKKYPHCKQLANEMAVCAFNMGKAEEANQWKKTAEQP